MQVGEYLKYADACRAMALRAPSEALRALLGEMARQWSDLAQERRNLRTADTNNRRPPAGPSVVQPPTGMARNRGRGDIGSSD